MTPHVQPLAERPHCDGWIDSAVQTKATGKYVLGCAVVGSYIWILLATDIDPKPAIHLPGDHFVFNVTAAQWHHCPLQVRIPITGMLGPISCQTFILCSVLLVVLLCVTFRPTRNRTIHVEMQTACCTFFMPPRSIGSCSPGVQILHRAADCQRQP